MTRKLADQGGRPGRKTNQQIIEDYLQGLDLSPEVRDAIRQADPRVAIVPTGAPGNFRDMRDRAAQELWAYFQTAGGVAKVQAFRAIDEMAKREPEGGEEKEPEPLLADVLADVVTLSPIRKRAILSENRVRYAEELAAIDALLSAMEAVAA